MNGVMQVSISAIEKLIDRLSDIHVGSFSCEELMLIAAVRSNIKEYKIVFHKPSEYVQNIKFLRSISGMGLKETKDIVDGANVDGSTSYVMLTSQHISSILLDEAKREYPNGRYSVYRCGQKIM